jgi:hypothetical protein
MEPVGSARPVPSKFGVRLALCGAGIVAGCVVLAVRYPLAQGLFDPRSRWTRMEIVPAWPMFLHLALYLFLTVCYVLALRLVFRYRTETFEKPHLVAIIGAVWLASSAALWFMTPGGESHDLFDYIFRGRMLVEYGGSPLRDTPAQFGTAPFLAHITWRKVVDTYGPLWEYASGGAALAARSLAQATGRWVGEPAPCPPSAAACELLAIYVLAYRLMATALAGVCGWLIYGLVRRETPDLAPAALVAWLWNPLLLLASAGGAHNDLWLIAFWLLAFWCCQRRWWLAGLLALALAAHIKLTALLLAPLFLLWIVRQAGWRRAVRDAVLAVLLAAPLSWALYRPLGGWETLPRMLYERALYVANSPHRVVYEVLRSQGWDPFFLRQITISWPSIIFPVVAVVLCVLLLGMRRRDWGQARGTMDSTQLWRAAAILNLVYLLVGSFWFQFWYVLWVLAPAALAPQSRLTRWVLPWLSFGAMSSQFLGDYLPLLPGQPLDRMGRAFVVVGIIWVPVVAAWLATIRAIVTAGSTTIERGQ